MNEDPTPAGALTPAQSEAQERAMALMLRRNQGTKANFGQVNVGLFFEEKVLVFKPNEMRLLREMSPYTSVEDAAKKAKLTPEFAYRFLKSKKAREFMRDKFQQIAVQEGWTVERIFAEADAVWRGKKIITREQMDMYKEIAARVVPKQRSGGSESGAEKPQITINIGAVDEAYRRNQAIEADILDASVATP